MKRPRQGFRFHFSVGLNLSRAILASGVASQISGWRGPRETLGSRRKVSVQAFLLHVRTAPVPVGHVPTPVTPAAAPQGAAAWRVAGPSPVLARVPRAATRHRRRSARKHDRRYVALPRRDGGIAPFGCYRRAFRKRPGLRHAAERVESRASTSRVHVQAAPVPTAPEPRRNLR